MTSAAPAKFTFDLDLGHAQAQSRVMSDSDIEHVKTTAKSEGYAEGYEEGQSSSLAKSAAALTASAEAISKNAAQIFARLDAVETAVRTEAVTLAATIARKLAGGLIAQKPEAELDALISECVGTLDRTPHLVVRCNDALTDKFKELTEAHMAAAGYSGRLIVLGDPEIPPGDGRLEWADGGLERDMQAIQAQIEHNIQTYLEAGAPASAGEEK